MTDNKWTKFRMKENIEAFQMTKTLHDKLIKTMVSNDDTHIIHNNVEFLLRTKIDRTNVLGMKVADGEGRIFVDDWIIKESDDGGYTVMGDICFKNTYEQLGEEK